MVCRWCGARRDLFVVWAWRPPHPARRERVRPGRAYGWARCVDGAACDARVRKRRERAAVRGSMLVLELPSAPGAPFGMCRWCGEALTGRNGMRRNYCYPDREGRDCVAAWHRSRTYDAREAVRRTSGTRCADCGVECEPDDNTRAVSWDADHEVPLEDGGEHTLGNLRCRCCPCHRRKTARENRERAAARREAA